MRYLYGISQRPAGQFLSGPCGHRGDKEIRTVEGLARGRELHPWQSAFVREEAVQCGYGTPGMPAASVVDQLDPGSINQVSERGGSLS